MLKLDNLERIKAGLCQALEQLLEAEKQLLLELLTSNCFSKIAPGLLSQNCL